MVRWVTCTRSRARITKLTTHLWMEHDPDLATDFQKELDADFGSDSDSPEPEIRPSLPQNSRSRPQSLHELLNSPNLASVGARVSQLDFSIAEVSELVSVHPLIPKIREELYKYAGSDAADYYSLLASVDHDSQPQDFRFLMQLSELPTLVNDEIALLHRYACVRYRVVFPELEQLIPSPVDYCRVVAEIGQELVGIRAHEPKLKQIVSGEKVLAVVMAALQQFNHQFELSESDMSSIRQACGFCVDLSSFLREVSEFISAKLLRFAPNVASLIGPVATSQLLISVGSLKLLALTPACNLASFGVRDLLSQTQTRSNFIRATGYLYYCDVVKGLPPEVVKQALRVLSGKVVLAARVDLSGSSPDGDIGAKYLQEVQAKIDKLLTPPDRTAPKALPVPKEQKSKKRAGRRLRKIRERFQMSELRKAQNKMEFGKQEQVVVDSFGEEVGLGMTSLLETVQINRNTDARMSKAMISRLQQQKTREDLDTIVLAAVEKVGGKDGKEKSEKSEKREKSEWGRMKRRRLDVD